MGLLDGKVAIVTGAGHGIGRGHALELAAEGAKVVVNDLGCSVSGEGTGQDADLTVDLIRSRGGEAVGNYDDVADFGGAERMVRQAVDEFGKLDILVNNAGIARDSMIFNMTEDAWDAVIRVHLKGTFAPTHHAAVYWRSEVKAGRRVAGRVITTTSGAGIYGNVGQANYATAKLGLVAFTMTTSVELRRLGVTVNCIAPTGSTRISSTIPRPGFVVKEPDEYTDIDPMDPSASSPVVAWLASDEAAHVTGQVLRAYGDRLTRLAPLHYEPELDNGGKRWTAAEAGLRINTDIFGCVTPGLRY
jgi:NAD(P)-dependent dehydrogenase (short-subunit alcohol dehydrogenase family)